MTKLPTDFDATSIEPAQNFEVLPPNKYLVQIVESEMRPTKDGNGQYLWAVLEVLEGPYKGRRLFDLLNLVNANPQTVEIAQRTLSAICRATNRMQVKDSQELHLIPFTVDVQVRPPKNGYGESNKLRYLPKKSAVTAATIQPGADASSQHGRSSTPAGARPIAPWKRTE